MKVLFIYPSYENLGIEYLSAYIKKLGHSAELLFDPCLFNDTFIEMKFFSNFFSFREKIIEEAIKRNPDVIAFSVLTDTFQWACELSKEIKKRCDIPIVAGGIHVTSALDTVLTQMTVDYCIRGEGEEAFAELLDAIESKKGFENIRNLVFKKNGHFVINEIRDPINNLDSLPFPDKSLYDHTPLRADDFYAITASRGCPYYCSFCNENLLRKLYKGKFLRMRSVENVIQEITEAKKKYKFSYVNFFDELFTWNKKWLKDFVKKYPKESGIPYYCCVHPTHIDEETARMLAESGCIKVDLGVQTINENLKKKVLFRHESKEEVKKCIEVLKKFKITVCAENIINLPGEKEEHLIELVNFYNNVRPSLIKIFHLKYFPSTDIVNIGLEMNALKKKDIELINQGIFGTSFTLGGTNPTTLSYKINILFAFLLYLPAWLNNIILKYKLYKLIPSFKILQRNFVLIRLLNVRGKKSDLLLLRHTRMYYFYIKEKVKQIFSYNSLP